jgi:hypothetical protein
MGVFDVEIESLKKWGHILNEDYSRGIAVLEAAGWVTVRRYPGLEEEFFAGPYAEEQELLRAILSAHSSDRPGSPEPTKYPAAAGR